MTDTPPRMVSLTDTDLDFVVGEATQSAADADRIKQLIDEDEQFRAAILGDEKVFQRLTEDEETFLMVSPALYFEVLLRQSLRDLETAGYTVERDGRADLPVFDTQDVVKFLSIRGVLDYLAHMLASFTRINSYAVPVRIRRGIRRRVVYNDMDIDSLVRHCATADPEQRFGFYKRIADVLPLHLQRLPGVRLARRPLLRPRPDARCRIGPHPAQPVGLRGAGQAVLRPGRRPRLRPAPGADRRVPPARRPLCHRTEAPWLHRCPLPARHKEPAVRRAVRLKTGLTMGR